MPLNPEYLPTFVVSDENNYQPMGENVFCNDKYHAKRSEHVVLRSEREVHSDEEFYNFDDDTTTASVALRKETTVTSVAVSTLLKRTTTAAAAAALQPPSLPSSTTTSTANRAHNATTTRLESVADIWGPPTSLYPWTPSGLSASPSTVSSDTASAISLSRLLRFEEKKVSVALLKTSEIDDRVPILSF
jgi:hypothetical protein